MICFIDCFVFFQGYFQNTIFKICIHFIGYKFGRKGEGTGETAVNSFSPVISIFISFGVFCFKFFSPDMVRTFSSMLTRISFFWTPGRSTFNTISIGPIRSRGRILQVSLCASCFHWCWIRLYFYWCLIIIWNKNSHK